LTRYRNNSGTERHEQAWTIRQLVYDQLVLDH
jgi:hypothetical protein